MRLSFSSTVQLLTLGAPMLRRASPFACAVSARRADARGSGAPTRRGAATMAAAGEVYFIMGGPGAGKGTQCARLLEWYNLVHLSAGDLLRAEVASGSEVGRKIRAVIDEGKIVTSETTVGLLTAAMAGRPGPFLIDGFPRSLSNHATFEAIVRPAAFMLFLDLSEAEMQWRLLKRGWRN